MIIDIFIMWLVAYQSAVLGEFWLLYADRKYLKEICRGCGAVSTSGVDCTYKVMALVNITIL